MRVQVTIDSSDVQHEKVVTKIITPVIHGLSVAPLKREQEDLNESSSNKKSKC